MRRALFLCAIFLVTFASPFIATSQAAASEDVLVCCDAAPVELYLIGGDSNKRLTPFVAELAEEPQSVSVGTSISRKKPSEDEPLPNTWGGDVPSSTWTFSMNYEVANAAGVQINATATVSVGPRVSVQPPNPALPSLPKARVPSVLTSKWKPSPPAVHPTSRSSSPFRPCCSVSPPPMRNWNSFGAAKTKRLRWKPLCR